MGWKFHASALALGVALYSSAGWAQDTADAPAPAANQPAAEGKQVYVPADFARFAPVTAYDMLVQVPGFTIRQADQERGLGQASENVLINGQRIANKTGGAVDELRRVAAASVERIEIVDASTLGIAGLSGQVANVIVAQQKAGSGQFEWRPDFRAHYAEPNFTRGSISYTDQAGPVEYTLSLNSQTGRGAFGGPIAVTDPVGNRIENRDQVFHSESWLPTFQTKLTYDPAGASLGNLTLAYTPYWAPLYEREVRTPIGGDVRTRTTEQELDGYYYDVNADYAFKVGPGTLKLIGLRHFDHEPIDTVQVTEFASGAPDEGIRFLRDSRIGETVLRGEYGWKGGKNDWQLTFERAYNSLDQRGSLFVLEPSGEFEPVDYPEGSGHVVETRYEGLGTWSRALSAKVDLQVAAGAEISELGRVDGDVPPSTFFRPKGSVTLGWRPDREWDFSLKLRRRVGQISFYDFLAQPNLREERENTGNPDLVPPQSWEAEVEAGKSLGAWGQTRLTVYYHLIEDIVDIIPIGEDGEAVGNLPRANRLGAQWRSTFQFDPIGWKGAKLDLTAGFEDTSVRDPLSGEKRAISGTRNRWIEASLRHDIPGSTWAWGMDAEHGHYARNFYLTEINRSWEGPVWLAAYVENKDVLGLTVRAGVNNLLNARHRFERTVYNGRRLRDPVLYSQSNDQLIGPIFFFLVKGTF
ncbi:MAG TPA: TonB-dependent receptor [Croceibacterium sp.]